MKILIAYYSRSGHTKAMAEVIAQGIKEEKVAYELKEISKVGVDELLEYDGLIFGSPTYYGQMAADVKRLFDVSVKHHGKLSGKVGGAFTSCGAAGCGGETAVLSILKAFLIHGMIVIGDAHIQHYAPIAVEAPDAEAQETCVKYGKRIAALVKNVAGK